MERSFAVSYRSASAAKEYTLIKTINVGSTAKVQLAHHVETDKQVCNGACGLSRARMRTAAWFVRVEGVGA